MRPPEAYHHNELAEDLINVLSRCPKEKGYTPDTHKQEKILRSLPENTAENLYAHLHAVQKERDYFAQIRGDETGSVHDGIVLRGEVFEILVEADPELGNKTPLAEEILSLIHNPVRFDLEDRLGFYRNPDLAFISFDEDRNITIHGAGEAKLGYLNYRAFRQLSSSGIKYGITRVTNYLNKVENLEEYGLSNLAAKKKEALISSQENFLKVSPDFKQVLIVPANKNIENPESLLIKHDDFPSNSRELMIDILKKEVEIKRAAFSYSEVLAITNYFLEKIDELREQTGSTSRS